MNERGYGSSIITDLVLAVSEGLLSKEEARLILSKTFPEIGQLAAAKATAE